MEIERQNLNDFADYQCRIHHSNNWLMGNPPFHRFHWNSIDTVPEFDLVIIKILIMDNSTLEGDIIGKDEPFFGQI